MNRNEKLKDVNCLCVFKDGDEVKAVAMRDVHNVLLEGSNLYTDYGSGSKVVARASAKCNPDDIFDFNIGAKLALDRLYEGYDMTPKPKRKKYTGVIYCVFNIPSITSFPNKTSSCVYKVKNGRIVNTVLLPCHNEDDFLIYDDMTEKALCDTLNELYFCSNHIINAGYLNIHDKT